MGNASRFICCAAAASIALSLGAAGSETMGELEGRRDGLISEQDDLRAQLDVVVYEKNQAEIAMEAMDKDLTEITDGYLRVSDKLDKISGTLGEMEEELKLIQGQRDDQYELLKHRLNFMYKNGQIGYLDIIFEAKSFTDFINRVEYINRIAKNDKTLLNKLTNTTALITETYDEIDKQKSSLEQAVQERAQKQAELQAAMGRKQELYNKLDSDMKSYEEKLEALQKAEGEIVQLIKEKEKENAAMLSAVGGGYASATMNVSPYTGSMLWPVPGKYMLSDVFRARYNPVNGNREFHAGVDIPAPTGAGIVAAESGVVITSGWKNGYGNTIIIDHGNGITTLYGHNSQLVASMGQYVEKGDLVARAGSTGNSTGPHCHFEVRINGSPVNPNTYLNI